LLLHERNFTLFCYFFTIYLYKTNRLSDTYAVLGYEQYRKCANLDIQSRTYHDVLELTSSSAWISLRKWLSELTKVTELAYSIGFASYRRCLNELTETTQ